MDEVRPYARLVRFLRMLWNYSGTLAALSLFAGVLALGTVHMRRGMTGMEENARFFRGVYHSRDCAVPHGVDEITLDEANSLPCYVKFIYDGDVLKRIVAMNNAGIPQATVGVSVAEQRMSYDRDGRLKERNNYDSNGRLCADMFAVTRYLYEYNDRGQLIKISFCDAKGKLTENEAPGYALEERFYDGAGKLLQRVFRGANGLKCVNRDGEQEVRYTYADNGKLEAKQNYIGGCLANNAVGVAEERWSYDHGGRPKRMEYRNAKGETVVCRAADIGYAAAAMRYDSRGNCASVRYFDADHNVSDANGMKYAEHVCNYDGYGNPVYECFIDAAGELCVPPAIGYAEKMCNYDTKNRLRREYFWDAEGRPGGMPSSKGRGACYERRYEYDDRGKTVLSLYTDGSSELVLQGNGRDYAESHGDKIARSSARVETFERCERMDFDPDSCLACANRRERSALNEVNSPPWRAEVTSNSACRNMNEARSAEVGGCGISPVAK